MGHYKHYGEDNPNYKNTTLKERYSLHPELCLDLARPRAQNGMARKIVMIDTIDNKRTEYECMVDCAEYLVQNDYVRGKSIYAIAAKISEKAKSGELYFKRFIFNFID